MTYAFAMKATASLLFLLPSLTMFAACSGGGGGTTGPIQPPTGEVVASGTLTLQGGDTGAIGTTLTIGDVARLNGPNTVQTYFCIDSNSRVGGFEYQLNEQFQNLTFVDPLNTFVINVIDDSAASGLTGISMTVSVQGVDYDYTCTFCPGLTVDTVAQTIDFAAVEVQPSGAATDTLMLDGTIAYGIPQ